MMNEHNEDKDPLLEPWSSQPKDSDEETGGAEANSSEQEGEAGGGLDSSSEAPAQELTNASVENEAPATGQPEEEQTDAADAGDPTPLSPEGPSKVASASMFGAGILDLDSLASSEAAEQARTSTRQTNSPRQTGAPDPDSGKDRGSSPAWGGASSESASAASVDAILGADAEAVATPDDNDAQGSAVIDGASDQSATPEEQQDNLGDSPNDTASEVAAGGETSEEAAAAGETNEEVAGEEVAGEDHWSSVVTEIGVDPGDATEPPRRETTSSTSPRTDPTPEKQKKKKKAPPQRGFSDWGGIAKLLGLAAPSEEDVPASTGDDQAGEPTEGESPAIVEAESVEIQDRAAEDVDVPSTDGDSSPGKIVTKTTIETVSFQVEETIQVEEEFPGRLEELPGYVEPPTVLDDSDTLDEMFDRPDDDVEKESSSEAKWDADEEGESEPTVKKRRRRRGGRRRRSEDSSKQPRSEDADNDATADETPSVSDFADDDDDEDREPAVRRRRRRRRQSSETDGQEVETQDEPSPEEETVPAARKRRSDDDEPESEEGDSAPRRPRRSRRSSKPERSKEAVQEGDESEIDEVGSESTGAPKHRKIPTWSEAISIVIDANLESRSKSGGNSRGSGRGRRRGRR